MKKTKTNNNHENKHYTMLAICGFIFILIFFAIAVIGIIYEEKEKTKQMQIESKSISPEMEEIIKLISERGVAGAQAGENLKKALKEFSKNAPTAEEAVKRLIEAGL